MEVIFNLRLAFRMKFSASLKSDFGQDLVLSSEKFRARKSAATFVTIGLEMTCGLEIPVLKNDQCAESRRTWRVLGRMPSGRRTGHSSQLSSTCIKRRALVGEWPSVAWVKIRKPGPNCETGRAAPFSRSSISTQAEWLV